MHFVCCASSILLVASTISKRFATLNLKSATIQYYEQNQDAIVVVARMLYSCGDKFLPQFAQHFIYCVRYKKLQCFPSSR